MYQHIMAPLDGSELAECVLPHLSSVAGGCSVPKVTLVRVVEPVHTLVDYETPEIPKGERDRLLTQVKEASLSEAKAYLDKVVSRLESEGLKADTKVLYGHAVDELASYATKNGVDLAIISTHGRSGVSKWVWGSVADRLLRSVCAPVFLVRAPGCFPELAH